MQQSTRSAQHGRTAAWLTGLAGAIWLLTAAGSGELAPPPGHDLSAWREWAAPRAPLTIVFAVLRLATLAVAWYLAGVSVVGLLARFAGQARLLRAVDLLTVPAARRLLQAGLGTGLAMAALSAPQARGAEPPPVIAQPLAQPEAATMGPLVDDDPAAEHPVLHPIPVPDADRAPAGAARPRDTWTIRAGDHLWSIAEQTLATAWGRAPSESQTAAYWQRLIAANRERLPDPANPDLILPGDVLQLPPVRGR